MGDSNGEGQGGAAAVFKDEFKKAKFGFTYSVPEAFCRSQWNWPSAIYIVYRVVVALYILAWLLYSMALMPVFRCNIWPAFVTNWTYTMLTLYLLAAAFVALRRRPTSPSEVLPDEKCSQRHAADPVLRDQSELPWDIKLMWALFAIAANFSLIVTLIYFSVLYPRLYGGTGKSIRPVDLHIHGLNSLVIAIDLCIGAVPVRLMHFIYPLLYGTVYLTFTTIYFAFDSANVVYPHVLDWNYPGTTVALILGLVFVVLPLFQLLLFGAYRLRLYVHQLLYSNTRLYV